MVSYIYRVQFKESSNGNILKKKQQQQKTNNLTLSGNWKEWDGADFTL